MEGQTSPAKPTQITIIIPSNAYFMSGIRDFTLSLIRNMTDFSQQWAFRFQSVVDELCNNAIEHGSGDGDDIKIIFVSHPHESLEIMVEDSNKGKKAMTAKELQEIVNDRRASDYVFNGIRGRGLAKIVSEWTDELEFTDIEDNGIRVRVKKYLNDPKLKEMTSYLESPTHLVLS